MQRKVLHVEKTRRVVPRTHLSTPASVRFIDQGPQLASVVLDRSAWLDPDMIHGVGAGDTPAVAAAAAAAAGDGIAYPEQRRPDVRWLDGYHAQSFFLTNFHDHQSIQEWQTLGPPLCIGSAAAGGVRFKPRFVLVTLDWNDQGWGNQKGVLGVAPGHWINTEIAPHERRVVTRILELQKADESPLGSLTAKGWGHSVPAPFRAKAEAAAASPGSDDAGGGAKTRLDPPSYEFQLTYVVGGGGGHTLTIHGLELIFLPDVTMWAMAHAFLAVKEQQQHLFATGAAAAHDDDDESSLPHDSVEARHVVVQKLFLARLCRVLHRELLVLVASFMLPIDVVKYLHSLR